MGILLGLKSVYTEYCCFLCTRDSIARYQHYNFKVWPACETLEPRNMNVAQKSLVDPQKVFLLELHIKLGIVKNFIKTLNINGEADLFFLKIKSPKLSETQNPATAST